MKALIIPAAIVFLIVSACTDNRSSSTITKPANETTSTKVESTDSRTMSFTPQSVAPEKESTAEKVYADTPFNTGASRMAD